MHINIIYQDDHLVAVEKPSGLFVHPYKAVSNEKTHLMKFVKNQIGKYLYPLHRLDRPVSGIVIFGLSSEAVAQIKEEWNSDKNIKEYISLVRGHVEINGEFNFPLKNDKGIPQAARTLYWPLWSNGEYTLVKVQLKTGRQHQIRRHFSRRMHQVVGDTGYGKGIINQHFRENFGLARIFLHAHYLKIFNPMINNHYEFRSPLPPELQQVLDKLGVGPSWTSGDHDV
ncbi:MAG: pseudouridine synthase [Bdellovibrionota bacterium]